MKYPPFIKRFIILILFFISLYVILRLLGLNLDDLSAEELRRLANDQFIWLIIIVFSLMFLQNLLNFVPIVLLISLNVTLFGFGLGVLISIFSSTLFSSIIFLCIRFFFRNISFNKKYERYAKKIENHGLWFVFISRLIPIMPTTVINIAAAISTTRFIHFVIGTLLGNTVYTFIISFLTKQIIKA